MEQRLATAEWANPEFIQKTLAYQKNKGHFWLGRTPTAISNAFGYGDDRHICLVSGSRGGKGTSFIIPNLCLWPGSVVVVDPKGENATVTAARRGQGSEHCDGMGQAVHVLDPFKVAQVSDDLRSCFNPLANLDPNNPETIDDVSRIADALIVKQDSKDPFWEESARFMIKGLILHILTAPEYEGLRDLVMLRELILRGDWAGYEYHKKHGEENLPTAYELLWEGLSQNQAFDGLVAGIGEQFLNMAHNAERQFESVLQVANVNTEFIDSPGMKDCLSASDFSLSELKTNSNGMSLYLSLPQRYMGTHYRWLRMMIALTLNEMEIVRGKPASGHAVLMCLDEFAGLKRMEIIENAAAQIAGYGVKLFFVLQSLEQLKSTYKDNWETFLSNSSLKIFSSLGDHFSREYVSKLIGETEVIRETRSESTSIGESKSISLGKSKTLSKFRSVAESVTSSASKSTSWGNNSSRNKSRGGSSGSSWKPTFLFKDDKRYNDGENWSSGSSEGSSKGWQSTLTTGKSSSESSGTSESDTLSETETYGSSHSYTNANNDTVHRRPLLHPDEIGRMLARIDDKEHLAYPGLALVIIADAPPIAVKRVNYYEDVTFDRLHDPHPDYELPEETIDVPVYIPKDDFLDFILSYRSKDLPYEERRNYEENGEEWYLHRNQEGHYIQAGTPIVRFRVQDTGKNNAHIREGRPKNELLIVAPVSGIIKNINSDNRFNSDFIRKESLTITTREKWYKEQLDYEKQPRYLGFEKDKNNGKGNGWYAVQCARDLMNAIHDENNIPFISNDKNNISFISIYFRDLFKSDNLQFVIFIQIFISLVISFLLNKFNVEVKCFDVISFLLKVISFLLKLLAHIFNVEVNFFDFIPNALLINALPILCIVLYILIILIFTGIVMYIDRDLSYKEKIKKFNDLNL